MKKLLIAACILYQGTTFCGYHSQFGQDSFVNEKYFQGLKSGVFVDIGAHDGVSLSNSCYFEKDLGWKGICIEPNPEVFTKLTQNRKCICVQGCVANKSGEDQLYKISPPLEMLSGLKNKLDPRHLERIHSEVTEFGATTEIINVKCYTLNELLEKNKIEHINFLSVDTEGGEFEILSSIDFSKYKIDVITVEDNYEDPRFFDFLSEKGFNFVKRIACDLIFVHKDFKHSLENQTAANQ